MFRLTGLHPGPDFSPAAAASLAGIPEGTALTVIAGLSRANLVFFLGVGFTEELLFRGYMLRNLGERMPLWGALAVSSVLFGVFHGLHASIADLAEITLGGFMLGMLRLATGTLWVPIGLHAAWDFIENGIVTTRLLPARGPVPEQTAAGWFIPILITMAVLLITRWRGQRLDWRSTPTSTANSWTPRRPPACKRTMSCGYSF